MALFLFDIPVTIRNCHVPYEKYTFPPVVINGSYGWNCCGCIRPEREDAHAPAFQSESFTQRHSPGQPDGGDAVLVCLPGREMQFLPRAS